MSLAGSARPPPGKLSWERSRRHHPPEFYWHTSIITNRRPTEISRSLSCPGNGECK